MKKSFNFTSEVRVNEKGPLKSNIFPSYLIPKCNVLKKRTSVISGLNQMMRYMFIFLAFENQNVFGTFHPVCKYQSLTIWGFFTSDPFEIPVGAGT